MPNTPKDFDSTDYTINDPNEFAQNMMRLIEQGSKAKGAEKIFAVEVCGGVAGREEAARQANKAYDEMAIQMERTVEGVWRDQVAEFLAGGSYREGFPTKEQFSAQSMGQLKAWLDGPLNSDYLEIRAYVHQREAGRNRCNAGWREQWAYVFCRPLFRIR